MTRKERKEKGKQFLYSRKRNYYGPIPESKNLLLFQFKLYYGINFPRNASSHTALH
jgi:hypothetical protein